MVMIMKEFSGFDFDDPEIRARMKYVIIIEGDLDINNAYAFESMKDLRVYLNEPASDKPMAVFSIKDITRKMCKHK